MEGKPHRGLTPPAFFLASLLAVVVLAAAVPVGVLKGPLFDVTGVAFILVGIWLNVRGSGQFEDAGRPIRPGSRGGVLVTDGVFRVSRNPMYLGMACALLGSALALGSTVALVVTPLFAGVIDRGFIAMEERVLEEEFGETYRAYRRQVRRWI